jgi:hypothetical protein
MQYVFSCGGGVQSTACLVLAAQGVIPYRTFVFANVGDKAESPHTIDYIRAVLKPFAAQHGIQWVDVCKVNRHGEPVDLYYDCIGNPTSVSIPLHYQHGGLGFRNCTTKSSCWFCPYHTTEAWTHRKREDPELFGKAIELEAVLSAKSVALGKDPGYLTRHGRPLSNCIPDQLGLFPEWIDEQDGCDSGYCMT